MRRLLTRSEVAERLRISEATVDRWRTRRDPLPHVRIGRAVRFPEDAIERWLERRTVNGGEQ